jgi:hypothetical protein
MSFKDLDDILLEDQEEQDKEESLTPIADLEIEEFEAGGNGHYEDTGNEKEEQTKSNEDGDEELAKVKLTKEDIEFMFDTMMKEAKHDELSIWQLFLGMMSTFTKLPIPHVTNSRDPGAGKSYLLNHVASFIPDKHVTLLAGTSEKTLFHRDGVMVYEDENHEIKPVQSVIADMQLKIEELQDQIDTQLELRKLNRPFNSDLIKSNKKQITEIEQRIKDIQKSSQKLIDLTDQIIIYQDTPPPNMISLIMSLLSQDSTKDQLYTFVEKRNGELIEKKNRLKGTPNLFYTQVIDDTDNQRYEEKNRRFIHITPDVSEKKIDSAVELISERLGLTEEEYDEDVINQEDRKRASHIIATIIAKLKQHSKYFEPKKTGVRVPFLEALAKSVPVDSRDVWRMTATDRIRKYLTMIAKINMDQRPKIIYKDTGKFYVIATFDDAVQVLNLIRRATSKMRPYQEDWFYNVFIPVYQDQNNEPKTAYNDMSIKVSEIVVGVTTEELAEKTAEVLKCPKPGTQTIRQKYLDPLVNIGMINKHESRLDLRGNIYSPVDENAVSNKDKADRFQVQDLEVLPTKEFLEHSLRRIVIYNEDGPDKISKGGNRVILDHEGKELSVTELVERYLSDYDRVFTL